MINTSNVGLYVGDVLNKPSSRFCRIISISRFHQWILHYNDVIMGTVASQITSLRIVYSTVYSDADQTKHQSSASLAFVRGIHRGPVNSPHKWPVMQKMFPFDDVIMYTSGCQSGPLFTKRTDVLPQVLAKSRSREIGCCNERIASIFDRHLGSAAAEVPVKCQSDWRSRNLNLVASRDQTSVRLVNRDPGIARAIAVSICNHMSRGA